MNKKGEHKLLFVMAVVAIVGVAAILTGVENASNRLTGAAVSGAAPLSDGTFIFNPRGADNTDRGRAGPWRDLCTAVEDCGLGGGGIITCADFGESVQLSLDNNPFLTLRRFCIANEEISVRCINGQAEQVKTLCPNGCNLQTNTCFEPQPSECGDGELGPDEECEPGVEECGFGEQCIDCFCEPAGCGEPGASCFADDQCCSSVCDTSNEVCLGDCFPNCAGKQCGNDGCGGSCGTCQQGELCDLATFTCVPAGGQACCQFDGPNGAFCFDVIPEEQEECEQDHAFVFFGLGFACNHNTGECVAP